MDDRRAWWRLDLKQVAVALALVGTGCSAMIWTLKAAGVAPVMFPGQRLETLEQTLQQEDSLTHLLYEPLRDIPRRVTTLELRVDTLTRASENAVREREALLYMTCAQYRATFPSSPQPQICSEVRRR